MFVVSDEIFSQVSRDLLLGKNKKFAVNSFNMAGYYQHDDIYRRYKREIIGYINNHKDHEVMTDGVTAGDGVLEVFKMHDILNTPTSFNRTYKNVLHIRLEDFVTHNFYLKVERVANLLRGLDIKDICVVCKEPNSEFEHNYIGRLRDSCNARNIKFYAEHNDILTDYYIMKEAELLICSLSTLSWCAAFFSDKINTCYFPDYDVSAGQTCKKPIENTILY